MEIHLIACLVIVQLKRVNHHLCHADRYYGAGWEDATIVTFDGQEMEFHLQFG